MPEYPPPVELHSVPGAELMFVYLESAVLVAAAVWALRRQRAVFPILVAIVTGTALASFVEPLDDVASRLWFATDMHVIFGVFDRVYPVFFAPGYAVYYGLGSCGAYLLMRRGGHRALLWYAVVGGVFDAVLESFWLRADLYVYFGPQPFEIMGFPLYWAFINTAYLFVVGYVFYLTQGWLRGRRLLIGVAMPVAGIGVLYGLAWPTWITMNTAAPVWLMWLVASLTMAGAACLVWSVCRAVERYGSPLRIAPRERVGPVSSLS